MMQWLREQTPFVQIVVVPLAIGAVLAVVAIIVDAWRDGHR